MWNRLQGNGAQNQKLSRLCSCLPAGKWLVWPLTCESPKYSSSSNNSINPVIRYFREGRKTSLLPNYWFLFSSTAALQLASGHGQVPPNAVKPGICFLTAVTRRGSPAKLRLCSRTRCRCVFAFLFYMSLYCHFVCGKKPQHRFVPVDASRQPVSQRAGKSNNAKSQRSHGSESLVERFPNLNLNLNVYLSKNKKQKIWFYYASSPFHLLAQIRS